MRALAVVLAAGALGITMPVLSASASTPPKAAHDASPCADFRDHGDDDVQLTG